MIDVAVVLSGAGGSGVGTREGKAGERWYARYHILMNSYFFHSESGPFW